MRPRRRVRQVEEPEGPARVRAYHVRDRDVSTIAGAPKAWRVLSVIEAAYKRGHLDDGEGDRLGRRFRAKRRLDAGAFYAKLFLIAQKSGTDSTSLDRIASVSTGQALTERQVAAIRALAEIEGRMGLRDGRMVRMICGENFRLNEAVMSICGKGYRKSVTLRFREALDALLDALEAARQNGALKRIESPDDRDC